MRNFLIFICVSFFSVSCDDGDILTIDLDFDQNLELCNENISDFLLYDVRTDPAESLSLVFPRNDITTAYFTTPSTEAEPHTFELNEDTNLFNYRTYNIEPTFCDVIPNPSVVINEDFNATTGTVNIVTTIVDDDNDGIPNNVEDENLDGDNNPATNPTNSDDDDIPDYLDQDDDNDNILTINEDDDNDGDGNPSTNPRNTDGDDLPDYLDDDDDGDMIPTRLEDEDENLNPTDDFLMDIPGELPRYRNFDAAEAFPDPGLIPNTFTTTITMRFTILNPDLGIINTDFLNFGIFTTTLTN